MKPSQYLKPFQDLVQTSKSSYQLIGDCILVERVPVEEQKTASGLILPVEIKGLVNTLASSAPIFVHVLSVGEGYFDEDGKDIPLNCKPGDIGLVGLASVQWFSVFDIKGYKAYDIGLTRESEIKMLFKGQDGYDEAFGALNRGIESQMAGRTS